MLVKDNDNKLSFNTWSGTDYLKTAPYAQKSAGITIDSSDDYSFNGEHSFKITCLESNPYNFVDLEKINNVIKGDLITLTAYVKTNTPCILSIFEFESTASGHSGVSNVNIPVSNEFMDFQVSKNLIYNNVQYIAVRLVVTNNTGTTYVDNIKISKR